MFYLVVLLRTNSQETASLIALRNSSKGVREEPGYIGDFVGKKQHVVEHQKITANHTKHADNSS